MSGFSSTRRRSDFGRGGRRTAPPANDGPLNPDVVDGAPEEEMNDPESVARGICLRALTGAPKTRQQLAELLSARGVPDDAAEAVLDRYTEVGLIDDAAFARAWVSSRQAGRGLARREHGGAAPERAASTRGVRSPGRGLVSRPSSRLAQTVSAPPSALFVSNVRANFGASA